METHSSSLPKVDQPQMKTDLLASQYQQLVNGFPFVRIARNCALGKEIVKVSVEEQAALRQKFEENKPKAIVHFIPASGAASRMFKDLVSASESGDLSGIQHFFERFDQFAFAPLVRKHFGFEARTVIPRDQQKAVLNYVLNAPGLGYAHLPKGAIHFHRYGNEDMRTAFEEHFFEAAKYAAAGEKVLVHFTIPNDLKDALENELKAAAVRFGAQLNRQFEVDTSVQNPDSDTPACYDDSLEWVKSADQHLLRRPAGHGALLENLNALHGDLIFVKNIDNVVPDDKKDGVVNWRKVLAGLLIDVRNDAFDILKSTDAGNLDRNRALAFCAKWLHCDVSQMDEAGIRQILNRPWRVCGMVANQGEPGGGPFAVAEPDGSWSLQIVEKAQIDLDDAGQKALLDAATHFNPVDLVLSTTDYRGERFDLMDFRNVDTGMRVFKSVEGRGIRALELPGLWNGSMHHWNTIFVEVPVETFNPVKTVFDLLRDAHQVE